MATAFSFQSEIGRAESGGQQLARLQQLVGLTRFEAGALLRCPELSPRLRELARQVLLEGAADTDTRANPRRVAARVERRVQSLVGRLATQARSQVLVALSELRAGLEFLPSTSTSSCNEFISCLAGARWALTLLGQGQTVAGSRELLRALDAHLGRGGPSSGVRNPRFFGGSPVAGRRARRAQAKGDRGAACSHRAARALYLGQGLLAALAEVATLTNTSGLPLCTWLQRGATGLGTLARAMEEGVL